MDILKQIYLFVHIHIRQLKKQKVTFLFYLLSPLLIVGAVIYLIASFFHMEENIMLKIGVVDQDQSEETTMIIELLEESSEFAQFIHVESIDEVDAKLKIHENDLSSYIIIPKHFSRDLYAGHSVTIELTGNSKQQIESYIIHELMNSVIRHIQTAQANILLINEYAKQTPMDDATRSDLIINEFMNSFSSVLGRETILSEEAVDNIATSATSNYFLLSAIFILHTLWLFVIYHFFHREEEMLMTERLKTYGLSSLSPLMAKVFFTFVLHIPLFLISLIFFYQMTDIPFYLSDMIKILILYFLYNLSFILIIVCFEILFKEVRLRLLIQSVMVILLLGLSGAFIPTLYFPLSIQKYLPAISSYQTLYSYQEILLKGQLYVEYVPLALSTGIFLGVILLMVFVKERVSR